jgi:hypothetical protein
MEVTVRVYVMFSFSFFFLVRLFSAREWFLVWLMGFVSVVCHWLLSVHFFPLSGSHLTTSTSLYCCCCCCGHVLGSDLGGLWLVMDAHLVKKNRWTQMMLKLRWAGFFWLYCNVDFPILLFDVLIPYLGYIVSCF